MCKDIPELCAAQDASTKMYLYAYDAKMYEVITKYQSRHLLLH